MRLIVILLFGVFAQLTAYAGDFRISSPDFNDQHRIPLRFTCDGGSTPPILRWSGEPADTQTFVLIISDPKSAIGQTVYNWVVFNIPRNTHEINPRKRLPDGARLAINTSNSVAYSAPCPADGNTHYYLFTVYALDTEISLFDQSSIDDVLNEMGGHILATAEMVGQFSH